MLTGPFPVALGHGGLSCAAGELTLAHRRGTGGPVRVGLGRGERDEVADLGPGQLGVTQDRGDVGQVPQPGPDLDDLACTRTRLAVTRTDPVL